MSIQRLRAFVAAQMATGARVGVLGLAALSAGCASQQARHTSPSHVAGPQAVAAAGTKVELEDDGLPVQIAPRHPQPGPDDPSEPFSPNYGSAAPQRAAMLPAMATPPLASRSPHGHTRMSSVDEDQVIRRAIAEHEMRNR